MDFDWGKFNAATRKIDAKKRKKKPRRGGGGGKGNAWRAYTSGGKKR
jgi:hypothetical protein